MEEEEDEGRAFGDGGGGVRMTTTTTTMTTMARDTATDRKLSPAKPLGPISKPFIKNIITCDHVVSLHR